MSLVQRIALQKQQAAGQQPGVGSPPAGGFVGSPPTGWHQAGQQQQHGGPIYDRYGRQEPDYSPYTGEPTSSWRAFLGTAEASLL